MSAPVKSLRQVAGCLDGVSVLNSLWLANAVAPELATDRATLEDSAGISGVERLHANVELRAHADGDGDGAPVGSDGVETVNHLRAGPDKRPRDLEHTRYGLGIIDVAAVQILGQAVTHAAEPVEDGDPDVASDSEDRVATDSEFELVRDSASTFTEPSLTVSLPDHYIGGTFGITATATDGNTTVQTTGTVDVTSN